MKFSEHGRILNRNKGKSGRRITQRTENNIAIDRQAIIENPTSTQPLELANSGNQFQRLWFQQDGVPAHRRLIVKARLQEVFGQRIISLGNTVEWPPRSPDLTPCDFFSLGICEKSI